MSSQAKGGVADDAQPYIRAGLRKSAQPLNSTLYVIFGLRLPTIAL